MEIGHLGEMLAQANINNPNLKGTNKNKSSTKCSFPLQPHIHSLGAIHSSFYTASLDSG